MGQHWTTLGPHWGANMPTAFMIPFFRVFVPFLIFHLWTSEKWTLPPLGGNSGPHWGPIGATLGQHWCHIGATLDHIGATLAQHWTTLGPHWGDIGATLGPHWGHIGVPLGPEETPLKPQQQQLVIYFLVITSNADCFQALWGNIDCLLGVSILL